MRINLRERLRAMLALTDPPHKIALAFAIGAFIGMSPFIGAHTIVALLIAWVFRLNKLASIIGAYISNPWTMVPILTLDYWIGKKLLGITKRLPKINWYSIDLTTLFEHFKTLFLPTFVGSIILGILVSIASYPLIYRAVVKYRSIRKHEQG